MSFARHIRQIAGEWGAARDLPEDEAHDLMAAVLDGGSSELETGALLTALHMKGEATSELLGFHRAMSKRAYTLRSRSSPAKPLVFPAYGGARHEPNLLPLLPLMLQRLGIPVLLHGSLEGGGRVGCAHVFRALGIMPCATLAQAQMSIDRHGLAFVPTAVLCPALANLLALQGRLGLRNVGFTLVKLLDPFDEHCVRVASASRAGRLACLEAFFCVTGVEALLLRSTEGEPFANPRQRPRMVHFRDGAGQTLFDEEPAASRGVAGLPAAVDAVATARWIGSALNGEVPVPHPLVNQFACCLFASGYTEEMNQAKAIAAVEAGGLAPSAGTAPRNRAPVS
jgi:anthranilate phosphoribosyltransferase